MSLEHIFRNINDIRVFDTFSSSQFDKEFPVNIDEIMDILDLPQREEIQIRDSIEHLVKQQILGVTFKEEEYTTGCKICKQTDDKKLSRYKDHVSHKPEIIGTEKIEKYYLISNKLNFCLTSAVMKNSFMFAERLTKDKTN